MREKRERPTFFCCFNANKRSKRSWNRTGGKGESTDRKKKSCGEFPQGEEKPESLYVLEGGRSNSGEGGGDRRDKGGRKIWDLMTRK